MRTEEKMSLFARPATHVFVRITVIVAGRANKLIFSSVLIYRHGTGLVSGGRRGIEQGFEVAEVGERDQRRRDLGAGRDTAVERHRADLGGGRKLDDDLLGGV